jgi:peptidyl-dipeptidase Dcp
MAHQLAAQTLALALVATGCAPPPEAVTSTEPDNPLLVASALPYALPPFDRIRAEHFPPALERGMTEQLTEIAAIAANAEPPTFENTLVALERSGVLLRRAATALGGLGAAHTSDELQAVERDMAPKLAAHDDDIRLNEALYARIEQLFEARASLGLDAESLRLLERYRDDFVRSGARLDPAGKTRLREINAELAQLATTLDQNVLSEVNDSAVIVATREELAGLTPSQIEAAAAAATARGRDGEFLLALQNTTLQPLLAALDNRALRERIQTTSEARGTRGNAWDNREIFTRMLGLRAERAALLGYRNHAEYVLADETAGSPSAVNELLLRLAPRGVENARREAAQLQAVIDATAQPPFELAAWDWLHYSEQLRTERYAFDEALLKPYFELDRTLERGLFFMAERLYGLAFERRPELPVYQEDVRVYEVFLDGEARGLFLFDPYARDSKRGGAWMNAYVSQSSLLGTRPVVANHLNIVKPPDGEPTLLTLDETTTMFHEFGHALHALFSNVTYPYFAGTAVPRDFVEYPSQVHEMWVTWPEVLANYAVHHETGEPLPQDLLERVLSAEAFNQGFATTEYLGAAIIDQGWHQRSAEQIPTADALLEEEARILADWGLDFPPVPPRYRTPYFSHIMRGYAAAYYSYIWSEVLDADTVRWFEENGGLKRENGDRFRTTLLSRGGSVDAMALYREFRGAEPSIEPLLARRGLN